MADTIDISIEFWTRVQEFRNQMAHIPYAARHQESVARATAEEIEAAYQAGLLPGDLAALWAEYRIELNTAMNEAVAFAEKWDTDHPLLKTRPEGG